MGDIDHIGQLKPDQKNARKHNPRNVGMIRDALGEVGAARSIVIDEEGNILAGNATIEAAAEAGIERVQVVDADGETIITVRRAGLSEEKKRRLAYYDNQTAALAEWDVEQVALDLEEGLDLSGIFEDFELDKMGLCALDDESNGDGAGGELTRQDVPDALFPTDNKWGVPVLDPALQADAVDLPVNVWGAVGRKSRMRGTYHFYTDDYRFEGLWRDPSAIVNSKCVNVVEPNFSTNPQMPRAVVLWHVYRKRWLARYWQSCGIRVFVDLGIAEIFEDINLLGIPAGWRAYACYMRQGDYEPGALMHFVEVARQRAGQDSFLLLVVGGEDEVQAICREHPQCVWVPAFEQAFYRNIGQKT